MSNATDTENAKIEEPVVKIEEQIVTCPDNYNKSFMTEKEIRISITKKR